MRTMTNLTLIEFKITDSYKIIVVKCRRTGCLFPAETINLYCRQHDEESEIIEHHPRAGGKMTINLIQVVTAKKWRAPEWLRTLLMRWSRSRPDSK